MKTLKWTYLRRLGACRSEVTTFRRLWPQGAPVTMGSIRRARKAYLDVGWLARHVIPSAKAAPLRAEYDAKADALWAEYNAKVAPLLLAELKKLPERTKP